MLAARYAVSTCAADTEVVGVPLLVMVVAVVQVFAGCAVRSSGAGSLALYLVLAAALTAPALVAVPVGR